MKFNTNFSQNHLNGTHFSTHKNEVRKSLTLKKENDLLKIDMSSFDNLLRENLSTNKEEFAKIIIQYIAEFTNSVRAILYILDESLEKFEGIAYFACLPDEIPKVKVKMGETLVGQSAASQKVISFRDLPPNQIKVQFSNYELSMKSVFYIPLIFNSKVYGVMELYYLINLGNEKIIFLEKAAKSIAITLSSILNNFRNESLLEETYMQKDLILAQEEELRQNLEELSAIHDTLQIQSKKNDDAFKELQVYNERIMASIKYAQSIQQSILPSSNKLDSVFAEHFVIYEPKDTVSGDFYWFAQVGKKNIVVVADCTGHGVPGAFMSMLGNNYLNNIVIENHIFEPKEILSQLQTHWISALNHQTCGRLDGMDLSVSCFEYFDEQVQITFAGAKSDLYYVKHGELKKIKGNRTSINGFVAREQAIFSNHQIVLDKGDIIYLFTDGLIDICNDRRVRYGEKRFERFIREHLQTPLKAQRQILTQHLKTYQQQADQRDDITLLAIKL